VAVFLQLEVLQKQPVKIENHLRPSSLTCVFFQLYKTVIARVWRSLLEEWAANGFAKHIVFLIGQNCSKIPGLEYRPVQP